MQDKQEKFPSTFTVDNFSSTTKLAQNEVKLPIGSKETINDNEYNPFENRQTEHATSTIGVLIHLLKGSLGTGILAMPNAFKNAGLIFGFVGTIVVGILCTHCVQLLVSASHEICRRSKQPVLGFSETAGAVFEHGPKKLRPWAGTARTVVDIALVVTYFMGGAVYIVFISTSIRQLVHHYHPELGWEVIPYMFLILLPLIITCQIRELKFLVPFSFLANVFLVASFGITLVYIFTDIKMGDDLKMIGTMNTIPLFFSTAIFAMEGIGVVMPLENKMKSPQHFLGCPGVLYTAMSFVVILYTIIGFFGYMRYGPDTEGSITYNIATEDILAQVAKVLIAAAVFFTYSLQFFVAMDITWRKLLKDRLPLRFHNIGQIVTRSVIVTLTAGVAAAVPDLEPIIGLVGSICFSILGLTIPSFVDIILRLETDFGRYNWILVKNVLLIIFSLFGLVSGSYASILSLISSKEDEA